MYSIINYIWICTVITGKRRDEVSGRYLPIHRYVIFQPRDGKYVRIENGFMTWNSIYKSHFEKLDDAIKLLLENGYERFFVAGDIDSTDL